MTLITVDALRAAGATQAKAEEILAAMNDGAQLYEVNTPLRIAHFLAQVGHESGGFHYVREMWGPTAAQLRYEGRADLGNVHQGDGIRFCGRDYMQTTGRKNYAALRDRLRQRMGEDAVPDFENHPEELEQLPWCVLGAFDYWGMRNLNQVADADDIDKVSDLINIGHPTKARGDANGFADRERRLNAIKVVMAAVPAPAEPAIPPNPWAEAPAPEVADAGAFPDDALLGQALVPSQEKPVLPLIPIALEALSTLVPQLAQTFGSGSEMQQRNAKGAQILIDAAKTAVGAVNEQDLIEKANSGDPQVTAALKDAVQGVWYQVVEAGGGGIAGARAANDKFTAPGASGFWMNPAFWITLLLLAMPFMLLVDVFFVHPDTYDGNLRTQIVTAILGLCGVAGAYWLGTSASSARKDQALISGAGK